MKSHWRQVTNIKTDVLSIQISVPARLTTNGRKCRNFQISALVDCMHHWEWGSKTEQGGANKKRRRNARWPKIFSFHFVPARHKSLLPEVKILALVCRQVTATCMKVSLCNNQRADELFNLEICGSTIAPKAVPSSQNHPSTHFGKHTLHCVSSTIKTRLYSKDCRGCSEDLKRGRTCRYGRLR